jgi:hypothetical protein
MKKEKSISKKKAINNTYNKMNNKLKYIMKELKGYERI